MSVSTLTSAWKQRMSHLLKTSSFSELQEILRQRTKSAIIYPREDDIFKAFSLCPFEQVKVVILGQDPYHGENQAMGLAFSVPKETRIPPSLKNIFKEIHSDLGYAPQQHGDLSRWATQGVLLLNSTLTVEKGKPGSHQKLGWEKFTDEVIDILSYEKRHVVYILWGNYARAKGARIDRDSNLVLEAPHPSPLSAYGGFFGSKPFSKTNEYLLKTNQSPIDWH